MHPRPISSHAWSQTGETMRKFAERFTRTTVLGLFCCLLLTCLRADPDQNDKPAQSRDGSFIVRLKTGAAKAATESHLEELGLAWRTLGRRSTPNGFEKQAGVRAPAAGAGAEEFLVVALDEAQKKSGLLQRLRNHPGILYVEPNYIVHTTQNEPAVIRPNDFEFPELWSLENKGGESGRAGSDIHAPQAWSITTGSSAVTVAVIDTGVDYLHPDLVGNMWRNPDEIPGNGKDDDGNGWIDDVHGYDFVSNDSDPLDDGMHGTHVAGIIGAQGNNQIGITGVCWDVSIVAIKSFDESGSSDVAQVIEGLHYAVENKFRIINASWGLTTRSRALEDVVKNATSRGTLIVAAAGNEGSEAPFYPAAMQEVISVAATDRSDSRAVFSRSGTTVDVSAPGDAILSTTPNNRYDLLGGTSMAAPHVSGIAALVLARHPQFTSTQVETILKNSVDPATSDRPIGNGRVNAYKAVLVEAPLPELRLNASETVAGVVDLTGWVMGTNVVRYKVEAARSASPTNWTEILAVVGGAREGILVPAWRSDMLADGAHLLRLTAWNGNGQSAQETVAVEIRNVAILDPINNDVVRFGGSIPIVGNAFGTNIQYSIEIGEGRIPSSWSSRGIRLTPGAGGFQTNSILGYWDSSQFDASKVYAIRLTASATGRERIQDTVHMILPETRLKEGFPKHVPVSGELPLDEWRNLVVEDLDGDGRKEILYVEPGNLDDAPPRLVVLNHDGTEKWSRGLEVGEPLVENPAVGDLDGDGKLEVVVGMGHTRLLRAFRQDGTELSGRWPVRLETIELGKVLADLDHDGRQEIVALSKDSVRKGSLDLRYLYVIRGDGEVVAKWDLPACEIETDRLRSFPAVANLDDDSDLEIVVVQSCSTLAMFDLSQQNGPAWVASVSGELTASPVIGDLDRDGRQEIVIGAFDSDQTSGGGVYAFDRFGKTLKGWPVLIQESFETSASLGDFDGDGQLEIAIPSWSSRKVHLLRKNGFECEGWPVEAENRGSVRSNVTIADVDGDERVDVVMLAPGGTPQAVWNGDLSYLTGVKAWRFEGESIDLHPSPEIIGLVMESSGGQNRLKGAPVTVCDLDGNGRLDLLAFSILDARYQITGPPSKLKKRSTLYAWELDITHDPEFTPWPSFQGGPNQDGLYRIPPHRNRAPSILNLPDRTIQRGGSFLPVRLDHFVLDPDHAASNLVWRVSAGNRFQIAIDDNRVARITVTDSDWTGEETVRFQVSDPFGSTSSSLVTLRVLARYVPPLAVLDEFKTQEDQPVLFDPLANDSDPEGGQLRIINISRANVGKIESLPDGRFRYVPRPNHNGTDSASYTISNGKGGIASGEIHFIITAVNDPPEAGPDQVVLDEDQEVLIDLLGNDVDVDGDAIQISEILSPKNGTVEPLAGGQVRYRPARDYNGDDEFEYEIRDKSGSISRGLASLVIRPVNDVPEAEAQEFTINRNTTVSVNLKAMDADKDELTYRIVRGPKNGELFNYPTVAAYSPKRGFSGKDSFTYVAMDGSTTSAEATVRLTILDVNNRPVAHARSLTTRIEQPLNVRLAATDADEDPLEIRLLTKPAHGTLKGDGTNFVYQPDPGYLGNDEFKFEAWDATTNSEPATIAIKVTDQNTAPSLLNMRIATRINTATNILLEAIEPEGNPLTYTLVLVPNHGRIEGRMPDIRYVPDFDFVGSDRFSYKVNDGEFDSNEGIVVVDVLAPNAPPRTVDQVFSLISETPFPIVLDASDADGDPLICPILKGPKHGRVYGAGTNFTYVPTNRFVGEDSFTFKAWDGQTYSREARVTLFVNPTPPEARLRFEDIETEADGTIQLTLEVMPGKTAILEETVDFESWREVRRINTQSVRIFLNLPVVADDRGRVRYFRLRLDSGQQP